MPYASPLQKVYVNIGQVLLFSILLSCFHFQIYVSVVWIESSLYMPRDQDVWNLLSDLMSTATQLMAFLQDTITGTIPLE